MLGRPKDDNYIKLSEFCKKHMKYTDLGDRGLYCKKYNKNTDEIEEYTLYLKDTNDYINTTKELISNKINSKIYDMIDRMGLYYTFGCDTACTEGIHIYINPLFVEKIRLSKDPVVKYGGVSFVLLHEMFHRMLKHTLVPRNSELMAKFPDHKKQNVAMDLEINYLIEHCVFEDDIDEKGNDVRDFIFSGISKKLGCYCDDDYAGMIWTEIYPLIKDEYLEVRTNPWVLIKEDTETQDVPFNNDDDEAKQKITAEIKWSDDAIRGYKDGISFVKNIEDYLTKIHGGPNWTYDDIKSAVTDALRRKGINVVFG